MLEIFDKILQASDAFKGSMYNADAIANYGLRACENAGNNLQHAEKLQNEFNKIMQRHILTTAENRPEAEKTIEKLTNLRSKMEKNLVRCENTHKAITFKKYVGENIDSMYEDDVQNNRENATLFQKFFNANAARINMGMNENTAAIGIYVHMKDALIPTIQALKKNAKPL